MNAAEDIEEYLRPDEEVEAVVFGPWGWSSGTEMNAGEPGYMEPDPPPVPFAHRAVPLSFNQAKHYMKGWSFYGGFGAPECYAAYIWTNQRIIWVTQYDGATGLDSCERNPCSCVPDMPGG